MKKQLILAALSAALLASPYAEAGSGFSRGSSSSSSSSASKSVSTPKPSAPAYKPAESKRDYGSFSGFGSSSSKKADTPKRDTPTYSYNPAPAQQPKPVDPYRATPRAPESTAALAPSPAKSGFGAEPKSNTGKKIAGVAAATALGGALYAANANHDAVAAYEAKQKAAEAPVITESASAHATTSTKPDYPQTATAQAKAQPAPSYQPQPQTHQSQPQVIVVQEAPRYRHDSRDDDYWYQRGRESARREQQYQAQRDYGQVSPSAPPSVPHAQNTQPAAPAIAATPANHGSGMGFILVMGFVILLVVGVVAYAALTSGDVARAKAKQAKSAAKTPNYTL
ncbi:hypothetical protein [Burkholderia ubonensis]|uniref:hypothetical protein n=1 Tax=Burkholderia ubonensis TaxID=101571 RepID=UPI00076BF867|nr:hypothetical protein [Burkholderia ubonensis]KVP17119.1 hypothetical protein WJ84_02245 [Burkholderia ubonensis]